MTRPELIKTNTHPYHITSRCLDKKFFPLPLERIWQIMLRELYDCHRQKHLKIHAFVLMGNHFHLLCQTPEMNLDQVMHSLLRSSSLVIRNEASEKGPLWSRYKWSLICAPVHYYQVYRYIYQNPLRAKLVEKVEDYPFSTLQEVPFPLCTHVPLSFGGREGENLWLNEQYTEEDQKLIRLGLRKFQFDVNQRKISSFNRMSLPLDG
jgi:REP element-mobilizing transposase RayT